MKGMKKGGVITAAIAQRNRDVILRQESWRERQIEREGGGRRGCATPGTRAVETGFHSAGWNQRHLDTFSFSPVENNCPSRIWEIHRETNEQWMLFRARSNSSSSSPSSFLFRSFTCSDRKGGWGGRMIREGRYYCNQQKIQFIAFHGKVRGF